MSAATGMSDVWICATAIWLTALTLGAWLLRRAKCDEIRHKVREV